MSGESPSARPSTRPKTVHPEALEFARSGRVNNRISSAERRERRLVLMLLLLLLSAGVIAGCVF